jgi:uncharacterized OsmC-like protein
MKKLLVLSLVAFLIAVFESCGASNNSESTTDQTSEAEASKTESVNPSYDPHRGEGKFTSVELGATIDPAKADRAADLAVKKYCSVHDMLVAGGVEITYAIEIVK